ncbi:MAG: hypothetical protein LUG48_23975, partial [Klebsiella quasipneumoniae]|nr:hypothetical protein [Klebsiella quasipneumoniae]
GSISASTTATSTSYSVGGIAGRQYGGGTIDGCVNNGTVTAVSAVPVGGITGQIYNASSMITNCYNMGELVNTVSAGTLYMGGITGHMYAGGATVKNCYSTGAITSGSTTTTYVKGLIGYIRITSLISPTEVDNIYYLNTIASSGSNISGKGTAVTAEELQALAPK